MPTEAKKSARPRARRMVKLSGFQIMLRHLHANDASSLALWAAQKKLPVVEAAAELIAFALTELRSRDRGDSVRPQLMGERAAQTYAPKVLAALQRSQKAGKPSPWLHVNYATGDVSGCDANPGGQRGHVFLDNRPESAAEWCDTAGRWSLESVQARLNGGAQPMGVK